MTEVAPELAALGIRPWIDPGAGRHAANAYPLAHAFIRPDLMTPMRAKRDHLLRNPGRTVADFLRMVESAPQRHHLVSAEAFCFLRTDAEYARLTEALQVFDRIVPIVVLREVPAWRASFDAQMARGVLSLLTAARLPPARRADGDWYFDHAAIRAFWNRIGPMAEISYEAAMDRDGSILPAVFAVFGADHLVARLSIFRNRTGMAPENRSAG